MNPLDNTTPTPTPSEESKSPQKENIEPKAEKSKIEISKEILEVIDQIRKLDLFTDRYALQRLRDLLTQYNLHSSQLMEETNKPNFLPRSFPENVTEQLRYQSASEIFFRQRVWKRQGKFVHFIKDSLSMIEILAKIIESDSSSFLKLFNIDFTDDSLTLKHEAGICNLADFLGHLKTSGKKLTWDQYERIQEKLDTQLISLHKLNLVHLNISPSNILITEDYKLKLTGFERARFLGESSEPLDIIQSEYLPESFRKILTEKKYEVTLTNEELVKFDRETLEIVLNEISYVSEPKPKQVEIEDDGYYYEDDEVPQKIDKGAGLLNEPLKPMKKLIISRFLDTITEENAVQVIQKLQNSNDDEDLGFTLYFERLDRN